MALCPALACDHRGTKQELAGPLRILRDPAQLIQILLSRFWIALFQPLFVRDRLLLNKLGRYGSALKVVKVQERSDLPPSEDACHFRSQINGILNTAIQSHASDWIVDVGGVAGQQHAPFAEGRGYALMRHVQISMHDVVGARLWKNRCIRSWTPRSLMMAASSSDGSVVEHRSPQAGRPVGRNLEAIAPRARLGEIAAV